MKICVPPSKTPHHDLYGIYSITCTRTLNCLICLLTFLTLLLLQVIKMDDCVGAAVEERIASMGNGDVMLLENVRFHAGEEVRGPTRPFFILDTNTKCLVCLYR